MDVHEITLQHVLKRGLQRGFYRAWCSCGQKGKKQKNSDQGRSLARLWGIWHLKEWCVFIPHGDVQ